MQAYQSDKLGSYQGRDLFWITLVNDNGSTVRVTNLGCIIQSILVPDLQGIFRDVTLGFDHVEDYYSERYLSECPYFGTIVGRYANRIGGGKYEYNGEVFNLTKNDGENTLHSAGSFSRKVWDIKSLEPNNAAVTFSLFSPDGDEGFPGNVEAEVTYRLTNDNELEYEIRGVTDQPTPMNMTNHAYFNLHADGGYAGDHLIQIPADNYFAQHPNLVVTGELLPVKDTRYDFTISKAMDHDWDPESGYDQAFLINKPASQWGLIASAWSAKTGISLEVYSSEPAVQFYSGGFLNGISGKDSRIYEKFSGFCFETHHHPNALNIPHFPNTIVQPGETYRQKTIFKFGLEKS
ncbi:MAG TPA: aldose epimerase family protein [Sphingobacteriaceae bacterium]